MSDDLGKKVEQIAQMLGQGDVPDNIKELVSLFADKLGSAGNTPAESSTDKSNKEDNNSFSDTDTDTESDEKSEEKADERAENAENKAPSIDPELIEAARKSVERLNLNNDARINLLHAIEPFMSSKRKKKISSCIQLLQIASISKLLNDREK
jgi:hypothetical protein